MVELFKILAEDYKLALIILLYLICSTLWKRIGEVEAKLDEKKLDKEDFEGYKTAHREEHTGILAHLKTIVSLLKGGN